MAKPSRETKVDSDKTSQATVQAISKCQVAKQEISYKSESAHYPLDLDLWILQSSCIQLQSL